MPEGIITTFKSLSSLEEQLKYAILLIYQLKTYQQEKYDDDLQMFEQVFNNIEFMRLVRHRDSLVRDYPAEYFGKDYGSDDPFLFHQKLEKRINDISMNIMSVLGRIIRDLKEDTIQLGESM